MVSIIRYRCDFCNQETAEAFGLEGGLSQKWESITSGIFNFNQGLSFCSLQCLQRYFDVKLSEFEQSYNKKKETEKQIENQLGISKKNKGINKI